MKASYIISLVAGILILINGITFAALGSIAGSFGLGVMGDLLGSAAYILAVLGIIFGIIVLYGALQLKKQGKQTVGGVLVLVFSIISIVAGGGFIIGLVLGVIGGILGLVKK